MYELESKPLTWEVQFFLGGTTEIVGGVKNPARGFATVIEIIGNWISKANPKIIYFVSVEGSRTKLYNRMVRTLAHQYGYVVQGITPGARGRTNFELKKRGLE